MAYVVTLLDEAVADLQRLQDVAIERELESEPRTGPCPTGRWRPLARP